MKVYALWFGGPNYVTPGPDDKPEIFDSLRSAKWKFESRIDNEDGRTPCVSDSEMHLFRTYERENENHPFAIIKQGPRGGILVERQ